MSSPYLPERGISREEGFEGGVVKRSAETAQAATAEQSRAVVQARFLMAINRPRNFEDARLAILKTCRRPAFAAKARYKKPQYGAKACGRRDCPQKKREWKSKGETVFSCDHICGLSIRAADEFAKFYGNVQTEQMTMYDDDDQRIVAVAATDLEHNITKSVTITIRKTIERKEPKDRIVLSRRETSTGDVVFLVRATDDEINQKEGALCAKARRNLLLQLIPADLLEEAEDAAFQTSIDDEAEDPDAKKKKLIELFNAVGVMPSDMEKYLGHSLDGITSAELADLRSVYMAINEGEAKWNDFVKAMDPKDKDAAGKADAAKAKMREKLAREKKSAAVRSPASGETANEDDFKKAYARLSLLYDDHSREIDDQLFSNGASRELPDMKDTTDPKEIAAVIKTAGQMKEQG